MKKSLIDKRSFDRLFDDQRQQEYVSKSQKMAGMIGMLKQEEREHWQEIKRNQTEGSKVIVQHPTRGNILMWETEFSEKYSN